MNWKDESSDEFVKKMLEGVHQLRERGVAIDLLLTKYSELCEELDVGYVIAIEEVVTPREDDKKAHAAFQIRALGSEIVFKKTILKLVEQLRSPAHLREIKEAVDLRLE